MQPNHMKQTTMSFSTRSVLTKGKKPLPKQASKTYYCLIPEDKSFKSLTTQQVNLHVIEQPLHL